MVSYNTTGTTADSFRAIDTAADGYQATGKTADGYQATAKADQRWQAADHDQYCLHWPQKCETKTRPNKIHSGMIVTGHPCQ
jgi:hypothetical protein